jgi:hypothetical protein
MACDIGLKYLPQRISIAPQDTTSTASQQDQDARLTTDLLCADDSGSLTRFYQLLADVLSSIAEAERVARAA